MVKATLLPYGHSGSSLMEAWYLSPSKSSFTV
jgi:hypothetical protein